MSLLTLYFWPYNKLPSSNSDIKAVSLSAIVGWRNLDGSASC